MPKTKIINGVPVLFPDDETRARNVLNMPVYTKAGGAKSPVTKLTVTKLPRQDRNEIPVTKLAKRGRKPLAEAPLTTAERQKRWRKRNDP